MEKKGLILVVVMLAMALTQVAAAQTSQYDIGFEHGYYAGRNGYQPLSNISYSAAYREGYDDGYRRGVAEHAPGYGRYDNYQGNGYQGNGYQGNVFSTKGFFGRITIVVPPPPFPRIHSNYRYHR
jgi:hypothetical protein